MAQEKSSNLYYTAEDVRTMLGLGENKAYEYLKHVMSEGEPFTVLREGRRYKIPKESFDKWIKSLGGRQ